VNECEMVARALKGSVWDRCHGSSFWCEQAMKGMGMRETALVNGLGGDKNKGFVSVVL